MQYRIVLKEGVYTFSNRGGDLFMFLTNWLWHRWPVLFLIRGLPGSGKSEFAKLLCEKYDSIRHFEADMYFMEGGAYKFDKEKLGRAHNWCYDSARIALSQKYNVIVSNTSTTLSECNKYIELGSTLKVAMIVIECLGSFGNIHSVPDETLTRMKERWVSLDPGHLLPVEIVHGKTCSKVKHIADSGYWHHSEDDTLYWVDGVPYCGRCHEYLMGV